MTPNPIAHDTGIDDDGVLTPDDLQLEDDRVDELGANRYVVRSERPATPESDFTAAIGAAGDAPVMDAESAAIGASARDAATETVTVDALEDVPEPHGIDVTLETDGELAHPGRPRMTSERCSPRC